MSAADDMRLEGEVADAVQRLVELWTRKVEAEGQKVELIAFAVVATGGGTGIFVEGCSCLTCRLRLHGLIQHTINSEQSREVRH